MSVVGACGRHPWRRVPCPDCPDDPPPLRPSKLGSGDALNALLNGQRVRRDDWPRGREVLLIGAADDDRKRFPPLPADGYLELRTERGTRVPWTPTHEDLLATTWEVRDA